MHDMNALFAVILEIVQLVVKEIEHDIQAALSI